jgi:Na+/H+-translocating membrane pyrophosphatase
MTLWRLTYFIPMAIAGFGILFSIIGTLLVKITDDNAKSTSSKALNIGIGCLLDLSNHVVSTIHASSKL